MNIKPACEEALGLLRRTEPPLHQPGRLDTLRVTDVLSCQPVPRPQVMGAPDTHIHLVTGLGAPLTRGRLADPLATGGAGDGWTRETILGCRTGFCTFMSVSKGGTKQGLSIPGFPGNLLRKGKRGRVLPLFGNRKFSFPLK